MGQLFGKLTNAGVSDPNTGQVAFPQPNAMPAALTPKPGTLQPASATSDENGNVSFSQPEPQFPKMVKPTYEQAAEMGGRNGAPNALSPGLSKAGKLATLLTSGLQGAMAGRAASENAVIQSGGRRSGGAGMGFEAGYQMPWQRAMQGQQLEQAKAQTEVTKAQGDMIPTPYGMMPAALAKVIFPAYIRAGATTGAAQIGAGSREAVAQTGAQSRIGAAEIGQRFKSVPGVGLFDTNSRSVVPGTSQNVTITPEIASDYKLPDDFIGKPMSVSQLASLERVQNQGFTTVSGENGPAIVNKAAAAKGEAGAVTSLGLGNPSLGRPEQVADPDSPGNTKFVTAGNAIKTGAAGTSSASVQAPKAVLKSATSGPIAVQITAFNTALQHADLLQQAMTALNNGDQRTMNSLKNKFKTEFGSADATTPQAIADAYTREVTKMLSAGHMTDSEIGSAGATLPLNASPQQMLGVIDAYKKLATSKMQQLKGQVDTGMKGKPNFPQNMGLSNFHVNPQTGERIGWDGKKWQPAPQTQ